MGIEATASTSTSSRLEYHEPPRVARPIGAATGANSCDPPRRSGFGGPARGRAGEGQPATFRVWWRQHASVALSNQPASGPPAREDRRFADRRGTIALARLGVAKPIEQGILLP